MSRYNGQLIATAIRPDVRLGSKTVSEIGRHFAHDDGLDGYDSVLVKPQQLLPDSEDLLCGNQYKTTLTLTEGMTNMVTDVSRAFPNLAHVWVGNTERVVTGLLTLIGNLTGVTFHVADIRLSEYQAAYPTLTFVSYVYAPTFPIPFIGETTLTAEYVRQVIAIAGGDPSTVGKVVVPAEFTEYESGVVALIANSFPNMEKLAIPYSGGVVEYTITNGGVTHADDWELYEPALPSDIEYSKLLDGGDHLNRSIEGYSHDKVVLFPFLDFGAVTDARNLFYGMVNLLYIPPLDMRNVTNCGGMMYIPRPNKLNLIPAFDLSSVPWIEPYGQGLNGAFGYIAQTPEHINEFRAYGMKVSFTLGGSGSNIMFDLTRENLIQIFNGLGTPISGQNTLTISRANVNKLSADEIAIATNKNWTLDIR